MEAVSHPSGWEPKSRGPRPFRETAREAHAERTGIIAVVFIGLFIGSVFFLALGESERVEATERESPIVAEPDPRPGRRY